MPSIKEGIITVSSYVGLAAPIFLAAWYFYALDARVSRVENLVQAVLGSTAPAANLPNSTDKNVPIPTPQTKTAAVESIIEVCAELLRKAGQLQAGGSYTYVKEVESLAERYGCREILKK